MKPKRAAIGIKTRTGRAVAVALSERSEFVCREELTLCDESTKQPYHDVMEMPWNESLIAVKPAVATIEKIAVRELRRVIASVEARGYEVATVAVVGRPARQLERIGNPHIRAHAAEGVLFRAVIEKAAKANRVESRIFVDPAKELSAAQKKTIADMRKIAGSPWRAEEKSAAMAAAAILTQRRSSAR
jgi:hypothetical protein